MAKTLASTSYDKTSTLECCSGNLLFTLSGHTDSIFGRVFYPDGKSLVSSSYDKTIKIWDVAGGKIDQIHCRSPTGYLACAFTGWQDAGIQFTQQDG